MQNIWQIIITKAELIWNCKNAIKKKKQKQFCNDQSKSKSYEEKAKSNWELVKTIQKLLKQTAIEKESLRMKLYDYAAWCCGC